MKIEQERVAYQEWADLHPVAYAGIEYDAFIAGYQAGRAARQRRGEPSGYAYRYSSHDGGTVIRFNNGAEVNGSRPIEALPYWFTPQPAEPVKVPSDKEIGQTLDEVRRNSLYGEHHWGLWREFALALLARYGQPAQTAASAEPVRYGNQENSNGGT